ncbi:MAG TPA: tetratricopeptide repeat protein [Fimbriimonadaceae bacterium]|nr:tetratricopeptide repeat protein [Fimbriimonadaceae bacterium]
MFWGDRQQAADRLLRLGYDYLDQDEPKKALKVADRLRKLGNSGSAEIAGRAFWMLGEGGEAIRVLEDGTRRWPAVGILWSYLGEYLSETGSYEAAIEAFEKARSLGSAWVDYNIALVLWRMGRPAEALVVAHRIDDSEGGPPLTDRKWLEACALIDLGRAPEAVELMEFVVQEHGKRVTPDLLSKMLSTYALALLRAGRADEAVPLAWQAIELDKRSMTAASVIRESAGDKSELAKEWRVLVEGVWHEPIEGTKRRPGFYATYFVVADDPEEALELVRPFEPEGVRATLVLGEAEAVREAPSDFKGVLEAVSGYSFFER